MWDELCLLDGRLSTAQKVTRVDWFIDELKNKLSLHLNLCCCDGVCVSVCVCCSDRLPRQMKVNSQLFSLCSSDDVSLSSAIPLSQPLPPPPPLLQIYKVLWHLMCADISAVYEVSQLFQKSLPPHTVIAEPFSVSAVGFAYVQ